MWLADSVFGRIPQFYFLVGLLFIAGGLYLGFDFQLAFYYIGFGLINCAFGIGMFMVRLQHGLAKPAVHAAISAGDVPGPDEEKPEPADESARESQHDVVV